MKTQIFRTGIDTLVYRLSEKCETTALDSLYAGLSLNSNLAYDMPFFGHRFQVTLIESRQRTNLILNYLGDPVIAVSRVLDMGISRSTKYFLTFYGAYFSIGDLSEILPKFTKRFQNNLAVSRMDLCLDTDISTERLWRLKKTQFKKDYVIRKNDHIETFYLGSKKGNDKYLIRVYDKREDVIRKGKCHLHPTYIDQPIVTRIEVEMHTKTVRYLKITPQRVLDLISNPFLIAQLFASFCLNEQGTYFYPLKGLDLAKIERVSVAEFTGRAEKIAQEMPYIKTFLGYGARVQDMGFDAVGLLSKHLQQLKEFSPQVHAQR